MGNKNISSQFWSVLPAHHIREALTGKDVTRISEISDVSPTTIKNILRGANVNFSRSTLRKLTDYIRKYG
jgi:DNA-directed RNA polymerase subunit F